ncbi:MAG TPA: cache domain-containing protein [Petrotogaceae bacterium]|nr:cache domain-containing protein [Petrotogaceae bacterium]
MTLKNPVAVLPQKKISYARLYKKYDWVIAMGTYTDDMHQYIEETERKIRDISLNVTLNTIWFLLTIVLVCLILMATINRYYFRISNKDMKKRSKHQRNQINVL